MTTPGGSAMALSATTRSSSTLRLRFMLLIGLATPLLIPRATAIAADVDRGGIEDGVALELTSPDLYTRFSGGGGDSGSGFRLQQAGSSLVIDGNALTVASSEPNATTWWLVELAPRDGLFAIHAVLVTQGDRVVGGAGESGDSSGDSGDDGIGSLRVLIGNDTRLQPSLTGGAWTECAPPGGDRSLRAQLFLCCSGAAAVVGRAVAVYASSADGRVRPLNLNEVTVFGAPRQCPPGLFGPLCERRCGRCAGGPAATTSGSYAACECSMRGCYEAAADPADRRPLINECRLASSTSLVAYAAAAAAAAGRLELISNRLRPQYEPRPPADRCAGRERRRSSVNDDGGVEEYVAIRHAAFDLSAAALQSMTAAVASAESSSVDAWLLVGNDSRSPPYAGSPRWAKCGRSRIASRLMSTTAAGGAESFIGAGRRRSRVVLSCDTPTVGRYAVALLRHATRAIADDDVESHAGRQQVDDDELVDAVGYAVLPAEQLLGFAIYAATATDPMTTATNGESGAAASAVDLSFLGYYWMNERRYATYMMLAFPALFAIVMMAATFAIACIKRKKVVAENASYSLTAAGDDGDDLPPLLYRTAGGSASALKHEREAVE